MVKKSVKIREKARIILVILCLMVIIGPPEVNGPTVPETIEQLNNFL